MSNLILILLLNFTPSIYLGFQTNFVTSLPQKFILSAFFNNTSGIYFGISSTKDLANISYFTDVLGENYKLDGSVSTHKTGVEFGFRHLLKEISFISAVWTVRNNFSFTNENLSGELHYHGGTFNFHERSTGYSYTVSTDLGLFFDFGIRGIHGMLEISAPMVELNYQSMRVDTVSSRNIPVYTTRETFTAELHSQPLNNLNMWLHFKIF